MGDLDVHKEGRCGKDNERNHNRFGGCRPHIADHNINEADGRGEQLVDGADEFRKINPERRVGNRLGQKCQHDQAGHDESAVRYALNRLDAAADGRAEDDEIKHR